MQAVASRGERIRRTPLAILTLVVGLLLGVGGGYSINTMLRPAVSSALAVQTQTDSSANLSMSATRHAAIERAEAGDILGTGIAEGATRHAAQERAEAGSVVGVHP